MATTPNMSIIKPVPLSDSNLAGANEVNAGFDVIDAHNHTPNRGVQIPTLGLNINADLPYNGFGATGLRYVNISNQTSPLASGFKGYIYSAVGGGSSALFDLFYNDGSGNTVQLTKNGGPNIVANGSITGLPSGTASVTFGAGKYTFQSATNIPASLDTGDVVVRKAGATSPNGITITTVNSLAANYTVTLPPAVPGSNLPLSMDGSGQVTAAQITNPQIAASAVAAANMATNSVATANIQALAVTKDKLAASTEKTAAINTTTTSTSFVTLGATITNFVVSGTRPVAIGLRWDGVTAQGGYLGVSRTAGASDTATFQLLIEFSGVGIVCEGQVSCQNQGGIPFSAQIPASSLHTLLATPAAGTYTVDLQARVIGPATVTGTVNGCTLYAMEL